MKKIVSEQDVNNNFDTVVSTLRAYFNSMECPNYDSIKLTNEYFNWIIQKTKLILNENNFKIPYSAIPNTITQATYNWLRPDKKIIVDKYYVMNIATAKYTINVKKNVILDEDIFIIMRSIVLTRKAVVWVDFGYNIGCEFGGRHPAIILKNLKDSLIVIPLSSQQPANLDYNVQIDIVYGFEKMIRWANITRITQVSLSRLYFNQFGDVKPCVLTDISNKFSISGII